MMLQMSGHMLLEEYAAVKADVASRLAALPFVAITVDGWSQKQGAEHCLAWCVAGSQETFMLDCVHTEADSVTAVYIANMFDEVISKHNLVDKACAFVTDTPSTNKAAWRLVEQRHPKTWWSILLHFRGVHGIGMGLHLPCATRMHSAATMMESLEVNKAALTSAVTDSSYERPGLDVKQQQRSASIKEDTLRAGFWDDNKAILQLMYPVTQFQVDLQSDTANMADVFYGATAIEMHYGQQAGGAAVGNQDPAALVAHAQLPSLHACLVAAKQPTTPSQSADPALFSVQPHLAGTPVAIALSWLKRQQELQQEKHCQAWMAGSRELLAEAIPLFKACWRYGDSQVLYLAAILDPRYKMLDFQFSPAQFSQAEQALSRLVTVDDSQADQPVAMALEQLRRGWGAPPSELLSRTQLLPIHFAPHLTAHPLKWWAERGGFAPLLQAAAQRVLCIPATAAANERVFSSFKHIWSDKRSSLLLGIYFNKRVLERRPKPQPEAEWQQFAQWMQHMPVEA
ncbi:hypothetical protein QJQ45_028938 [Haematococcus lacustris]|nr:hypothetical protein QJQ45_028938 [Haematococcus lacustris]